MSQTATITHLFAVRNAKSHSDFTIGNAKISHLNALPLQNNRVNTLAPTQKTYSQKTHSWLTTLFVLLAHMALIYLFVAQKPIDKIIVPPTKPMMVSLIAPPAPEPELVPVIEPFKQQVKPVIKPKKIVKKIRPIETPTQRLIEATTEQPIIEEAPAAPVEPVKVAEAPKAQPVVEKVAEDKIEPPRFGVSYLNNPAPDYPAMSRRIGEEGRVLMKVLVSADGAAEEVQIEKSSGSERLDNAAIQAVKRWRFIPANKNNQALSAYVMVPMKFSLDS